MVKRLIRQFRSVVLGSMLLFAALLVVMALQFRTLTAQTPDAVANAAVEPLAPLAVSQVLSYQARMLDPNTGAPKPDGDYQMTFSIYNVATGGSPLWTETKSVPVSNGFLSTLLGSTTALILNNFNGQELFLGVTLAGDPEMTPRQRLAHTAYAMFAENANQLDGVDSTGFAPASHSHSGAAINSGTVSAARIDGAIARDSEIFPAVLAADGSGSGLDADTLDGLNSNAFALTSHNHDGVYFGRSIDNARFAGSVGPSGSQTVFFHSLDTNTQYIFSAVPTTPNGRVTSSYYVELGSGLHTYFVTVTNVSSTTSTDYMIRYVALR